MNKYETIYKKKELPWGREKFYQSFELLNLEGERNTEHRFEKYKFEYLLRSNMSVLDIGSNCGFLDLYISSYVKDVTGVELETHLCELANTAKEDLKIKNVTFINEDLNKFKTNDRYDLILSLAEHKWLHNDFKDYITKLKKMLNPDGLFMIESHKINIGIDSDFKERLKEIEDLGFTKLYESKIDEGRDERIFAIFRLGKFEKVAIRDILKADEYAYYKRLDVAMTYATIEELMEGNIDCELYKRYHDLRHGWKDMNQNLSTLKYYANVVEAGLIDFLKPITLDEKGKLFDGCHRLSSAIYYTQDYILAEKLQVVVEGNINETKLLNNGLLEDDIEIMREKTRKILREYNYER